MVWVFHLSFLLAPLAMAFQLVWWVSAIFFTFFYIFFLLPILSQFPSISSSSSGLILGGLGQRGLCRSPFSVASYHSSLFDTFLVWFFFPPFFLHFLLVPLWRGLYLDPIFQRLSWRGFFFSRGVFFFFGTVGMLFSLLEKKKNY